MCRVCEALREKCGPSAIQGFYTQEVREEVRGRGGKRVGFDIVTFDGKRGPLARTDRYKGHCIYIRQSHYWEGFPIVLTQEFRHHPSTAPMWVSIVSILSPLSP